MTLAFFQRLVWGSKHVPRVAREMSKRECIVLGHLMGAKQALTEVDRASAQRHIESAITTLRQRSVR